MPGWVERRQFSDHMQFGARDNARLAEGWEPHPIEFGILKGGDP
jgi:hypothetical protein